MIRQDFLELWNVFKQCIYSAVWKLSKRLISRSKDGEWTSAFESIYSFGSLDCRNQCAEGTSFNSSINNISHVST